MQTVHILLLNQRGVETPHLLVTIKHNQSGAEHVIRCSDMIYNVREVVLLDDEGGMLFYACRSIFDVVSCQPVE